MKKTIVQIDFKTLAELLQLPSCAVIESVYVPYSLDGAMQIRLSGVGWEVMEGGAITHSQIGESRRTESGLEIDWKLPT